MLTDLLPVVATVVASTSGASQEQFERFGASLLVDFMMALDKGVARIPAAQREPS
jgi:hypothetical protein